MDIANFTLNILFHAKILHLKETIQQTDVEKDLNYTKDIYIEIFRYHRYQYN